MQKNERKLAIAQILEARFSLSIFEEMKSKDTLGWNSSRNDMGRGIYGEAIREMQRLETVSDEELGAELAAIPRLAGALKDVRERTTPEREFPEAAGRTPS
jgi:hypothetical protein